MIGPDHKLSGMFSPIYLGEPLYNFFNSTDKFGSIDPKDYLTNKYSAKLMELLPCVRSGIALTNSLTLLSYIYLKNNNLQEKENLKYSHFDDIMNEIFVNMKAEFYTDDNHGKILMTEAIEQQIINNPLSTQDVIRLKRPEFNQDNTAIKTKDKEIIYKKCYPNYFIQLLISNNRYSQNDLIRLNKADILNVLDDKNIQKQMIDEYNIIQETLDKWTEDL